MCSYYLYFLHVIQGLCIGVLYISHAHIVSISYICPWQYTCILMDDNKLELGNTLVLKQLVNQQHILYLLNLFLSVLLRNLTFAVFRHLSFICSFSLFDIIVSRIFLGFRAFIWQASLNVYKRVGNV